MLGGKDGQILFHWILTAPARGLANITAVDWHLKVKNEKCDAGVINIIESQSACKKPSQSINLFSRF